MQIYGKRENRNSQSCREIWQDPAVDEIHQQGAVHGILQEVAQRESGRSGRGDQKQYREGVEGNIEDPLARMKKCMP